MILKGIKFAIGFFIVQILLGLAVVVFFSML